MVAFFLYKNTLCNVCKIKMQEQEITSDEIYENTSIVDFTITDIRMMRTILFYRGIAYICKN